MFEEFSNLDHWNIAPYPSTIGVKKYIDAGFSFGTRFSLNKITSYGEKIASDNYYNVDGVITYNLGKVFNSMSFMPFLEIGGGYVIFDEQGAGYFNLGAGIEYWFGEKKKTAIILESLYKNTGETYAIKHFQHMIGLAFLFGGEPDTDGDGIPNFLSSDDCLVEGVRQTPVSKKKVEVWLTQNPEEICTNAEMAERWKRNSQLTQFDEVPELLINDILRRFKREPKGARKKLYNYFVMNKLQNLMEVIGDF